MIVIVALVLAALLFFVFRKKGWEIGPTINGRNHSTGGAKIVRHPEGWAFDFPLKGTVNYVTRPGSLKGKSRIVMRYRIEAEEGTRFMPRSDPGAMSIGPTLYFQRKGDDWKRDGYRWWAAFAMTYPIPLGEHEIEVPLDGPWSSSLRATAENAPAMFADAKRETARVGFTFGGGDGLGHGVTASAPARFVLLAFDIH